MTHTKMSWAIDDRRDMGGGLCIIVNHPEVGPVSIAEVRSGCEEADELDTPEDFAAHIVRAMNSHEAAEAVAASLQKLLAPTRRRTAGGAWAIDELQLATDQIEARSALDAYRAALTRATTP